MAEAMTRTTLALKRKTRGPSPDAPARADPNAFAERVATDTTGAPLKQSEIHRLVQAFLSECWKRGVHPMILLPRGVGKTTQIYDRLSFETGRDVEARALLVCANFTTAKKRVGVMEQIYLSPQYQRVFPKARPDLDRGWSSSEGLFLKRLGQAPDPTIAPVGITSQFTGARINYLILDDVVDLDNAILRNVQNEVIDKVRTALFPCVEKGGRIAVIGTPYTVHDLYATLANSERFAVLRCPVSADCERLEINCTLPDWPVPETLPLPPYAGPDFMRARQAEVGPIAWQRGYRLSPVESFGSWFTALDGALIRTSPPVCPATYAIGARIIQGVDLAGKSRAGTVVVTLQVIRDDIRVVDAQFIQGGFRERVQAIAQSGSMWNTSLQIIESNGQQMETIDALRKESRVPWQVIPHFTGVNKRGVDGVQAMDAAFANGSLKIYAGEDDYSQRPPGAKRQLQGLQRLIEELKLAPAKGTASDSEAELDSVMALWFSWFHLRTGGASIGDMSGLCDVIEHEIPRTQMIM
jgi:hypothetical protein